MRMRLSSEFFFSKALPIFPPTIKINVGSTVKQQLENDLALEEGALVVLKAGIKTCFDANETASRELFEHILVDEEEHVDWIETQLHVIEEVGYQNYLAQQIYKKASRIHD